MDAVRGLLIDEGHAVLSSRRITDRAGESHGSIRYHFGSLESLVVATAERETVRLTERQREMYSSRASFREKWRQAADFFEDDLASGYPKLLAELSALAWNVPGCRPGMQRLIEAWTDVLTAAVTDAVDAHGLDVDDRVVRGVVGLIRTSQAAMFMERLVGVDVGHKEIWELGERVFDWLEERGDDAGENP